MLNPEFPPTGGGASAVTSEIATHLVRRGHTVSVVTMQCDGLAATETKDGIRIFRVGSRRRKDSSTVSELFGFVVAARRFLRTHLRAHSYDITHAHFIVPSGVIARWVKQVFGLPYVLTSHGSDVLGYNARFRALYPLISRAWGHILTDAKAVTSPSAYLGERIQTWKADTSIVTIRNGVDAERFRPLPKENRILLASRLVERKGVQDVIEAVSRMHLDGWRLDVVGDGPYRAALERKTLACQLASKTTFHGWVDHNSHELRDLYGRARVFVSASYQENMSMSLLEALAARCWIVASDVGGTPEVVGAASLFPSGNVDALHARLTTAIEAASRCSGPPLQRDWRWHKVIADYEALYAQ